MRESQSRQISKGEREVIMLNDRQLQGLDEPR